MRSVVKPGIRLMWVLVRLGNQLFDFDNHHVDHCASVPMVTLTTEP